MGGCVSGRGGVTSERERDKCRPTWNVVESCWVMGRFVFFFAWDVLITCSGGRASFEGETARCKGVSEVCRRRK